MKGRLTILLAIVAFSVSRGTLFVGQTSGDILEVDPDTGAVINTITDAFGVNGLAADESLGAVAVPTMNEWGVIVFVLMAGIASVVSMRRRSYTA